MIRLGLYAISIELNYIRYSPWNVAGFLIISIYGIRCIYLIKICNRKLKLWNDYVVKEEAKFLSHNSKFRYIIKVIGSAFSFVLSD